MLGVLNEMFFSLGIRYISIVGAETRPSRAQYISMSYRVS